MQIYYTKYFENNNCFTSIAKKTNSNIKLSPKHYTDYISYTNTNTFFLTPTELESKQKIKNSCWMEHGKTFCNIFMTGAQREKIPGFASKKTKQKTFD